MFNVYIDIKMFLQRFSKLHHVHVCFCFPFNFLCKHFLFLTNLCHFQAPRVLLQPLLSFCPPPSNLPSKELKNQGKKTNMMTKKGNVDKNVNCPATKESLSLAQRYWQALHWWFSKCDFAIVAIVVIFGFPGSRLSSSFFCWFFN